MPSSRHGGKLHRTFELCRGGRPGNSYVLREHFACVVPLNGPALRKANAVSLSSSVTVSGLLVWQPACCRLANPCYVFSALPPNNRGKFDLESTFLSRSDSLKKVSIASHCCVRTTNHIPVLFCYLERTSARPASRWAQQNCVSWRPAKQPANSCSIFLNGGKY